MAFGMCCPVSSSRYSSKAGAASSTVIASIDIATMYRVAISPRTGFDSAQIHFERVYEQSRIPGPIRAG